MPRWSGSTERMSHRYRPQDLARVLVLQTQARGGQKGISEASSPPSARKVDASSSRPLFPPGGLIEQSNAPLQRGRKADTGMLELKPGDEFEIMLGKKQIKLIPLGSAEEE